MGRGVAEVIDEPVAGEGRSLLQSARLFEEVRCARHNSQAHLGGHPGHGVLIERLDYDIQFADDQESWRLDPTQGFVGQIRPTTARHHRANQALLHCGCNQRRSGAGRGSKEADRESGDVGLGLEPQRCSRKT